MEDERRIPQDNGATQQRPVQPTYDTYSYHFDRDENNPPPPPPDTEQSD